MPWAVEYPHGKLALLGAVHPVQLYDAAFGFVAFIIILSLYRRRQIPGPDIFRAGGGLYLLALWNGNAPR